MLVKLLFPPFILLKFLRELFIAEMVLVVNITFFLP